jgi:predicted AlkP superfamily pyrophosphatase or phosphodiesterase
MKASIALLAVLATSCGTVSKMAQLAMEGRAKTVTERAPGARPSSPGSTQILLVAFDGVSRELLYKLLREGKLPNLATLLGGDRLAHAYLDDTFLSNLPSTTMPAWVSVQTGFGAAETGVTGNEYFVREARAFVCPAPVSFTDPEPTLEIYTDGYLNKQVRVPSVYERIHAHDRNALVWVGMNHFYRGADRLMLTRRTLLVKALQGFIETKLSGFSNHNVRRLYANLDKSAIGALVKELDHSPVVPDVLTLYIAGTDLYTHMSTKTPDAARTEYLIEVADPALGKFVRKLREKHALDRWVIVTADHGHTQIRHDNSHAIGTGPEGPFGILEKVGFRMRQPRRHVHGKDRFSAVAAYGGAMAYIYLADRSTCPRANDRCNWNRPPRYRQDVLAAAEALYRNNIDGRLAPHMRGKLDMIFVRQPRPFAAVDLPFEVYVGGGRTMTIDDYLRAYPHPTYVAMSERMQELAVGRYGERAGDILLLAHNGDRDTPDRRYYFSSPLRSWHGSPSRLDSEIPLIVANRHHTTASIHGWVTAILGDRPYQRKITDIIMKLRDAPPVASR